MKYLGAGSGNDNSIALYADNQSGTQIKAIEIKQNGITYTYAYTYFQKTVNLCPNIYEDSNATGALNLNNSDIYNVNSIKFADACSGPGEGLQWKRSSGSNVDSIWVLDGEAYITPDRAWKGSGNNYKFLHEGNLKNHQFTNSAYGVLLSYTTPTNTSTQLELGKENTWGRYYGVVATTNGYAYVNVPWMNDSVTQKISSADTTYNLLLKNASDSTDQTAYVNYSSNIFYNPNRLALTNNGPTYLAKESGMVEVGSELYNMNSKLYTYGDTFTSGTTYVKGGDAYLGSGTNAQCHMKYDNSTKCLKFIFD